MHALLNRASYQSEEKISPDLKPKSRQKQKPVYIKEALSSVQGFTKFLRYKFSADQWFGTLVLGIGLYQRILGMRSSKNRQVLDKNGDNNSLNDSKTEFNKLQWIGNMSMFAAQIWDLLSSRNSIPPDGNSYKARVWDTLKHPERSQVQARFLSSFFTNGIFFYLAILHGFTSKGQQEEKFPRKVNAVVLPFMMGLSVIDLFGPKKKKPVENNIVRENSALDRQNSIIFNKSKSKSIGGKLLYPFHTVRAAWKENPRRIIALGLFLGMSMLTTWEGYAKRKTMLNRLNLASTENSPQWNDMRLQFEAEKRETMLTQLKRAKTEDSPEWHIIRQQFEKNGSMSSTEITGRINDMHNKLHKLQSIEANSRQWHEIHDSLKTELNYSSAKEVTQRIEKMRGDKLIESTSIIKNGVISFISALANSFFIIDQLHKGEKNKLEALENATQKTAQSR